MCLPCILNVVCVAETPTVFCFSFAVFCFFFFFFSSVVHTLSLGSDVPKERYGCKRRRATAVRKHTSDTARQKAVEPVCVSSDD